MGWRNWFRPQQRAITLADFPALNDLLAPPSTAGVQVNERTALNLSAYWNGVDVLSSQVATLPRIVYKRLADETRERAPRYPAYRVLHDQPNEFMTPFVFWQTLMAHVLTWGNAYAEIEFDQALRPIALWPITPDRISSEVRGTGASQRLVYIYEGRAIEAEDILHIPGMGFDGLRGYSVVSMARRSLGLAVAAETFGASFFGNGAWPGIVLEHPGKLSLPAHERLMASVENRHQGSGRAHRTQILEEGMKANKIGIPPDDAQFLESREFQVVEIARWLNLPPHKLKHKYGERPGGNLEAGQIEFLTDCLAPWLVRIEQECTRKLIPASQRSTFYVEHLVDAILRMDAATRASTYKTYIDMGVMSPELVARKENLPAPPKKPTPSPAKQPVVVQPPDDPQRMAGAVRALCVELVARFTRREADKAKRAARRGVEAFSAWVEEFYSSEGDLLARYLAHGVELQLSRVSREGDARVIARDLAAEYVARSKDELLDLPKAGLEDHVDRLVEGWALMRAHELADKITALGPQEDVNG